MEKYTKIFENINTEEWRNYCIIFSYDRDLDKNKETYLCNNETQAFIYLKNLVYEQYKDFDKIKIYDEFLVEYSKAKDLNDLYEIHCNRYRQLKVDIFYSDLNDDVELDDWIKNYDLKVSANKFNL